MECLSLCSRIFNQTLIIEKTKESSQSGQRDKANDKRSDKGDKATRDYVLVQASSSHRLRLIQQLIAIVWG
jgi:hypothetical protein